MPEYYEAEGGFRFKRAGPEHFWVVDDETEAAVGHVRLDGPDWVTDEPHGNFDSRVAAASFLHAEAHRA